nr:MAG TPA: hypothetical protein [Caudoviricetes sp.]
MRSTGLGSAAMALNRFSQSSEIGGNDVNRTALGSNAMV